MFLLLSGVFVYFTPSFKDANNIYPTYYFVIYFFLMAGNFFLESAFWVSHGSFCARVSDTSIGGTMMTLWAAISNMGQLYPRTLILFLIGLFTKAKCSQSNFISTHNSTYIVKSKEFDNQILSTKSFEKLSRLIRDVQCPTESIVKN